MLPFSHTPNVWSFSKGQMCDNVTWNMSMKPSVISQQCVLLKQWTHPFLDLDFPSIDTCLMFCINRSWIFSHQLLWYGALW